MILESEREAIVGRNKGRKVGQRAKKVGTRCWENNKPRRSLVARKEPPQKRE